MWKAKTIQVDRHRLEMPVVWLLPMIYLLYGLALFALPAIWLAEIIIQIIEKGGDVYKKLYAFYGSTLLLLRRNK